MKFSPLLRHYAQQHVSPKLYDTHIPLTALQKSILTIGSSLSALLDPYRHDMVADFGETTGECALKWIQDKMKSDPEGSCILEEKPRLNSKTVDFKYLDNLPPNTFGYHYSQFYIRNKVSPDTRRVVQFIDDVQLAYVMQRYREVHDITHTLLDMPTTIRGEVIVKVFEAFQTRLPMCITGGVFGALRLSQRDKMKYIKHDLAWAIKCAQQSKLMMNFYFEKRFEQDIQDLRKELRITLNPDMSSTLA